MRNLLYTLLAIFLLHSCVIEEQYHIKSDNSGTYTMTFDYSAFASQAGGGEDDGEFAEEMEHTTDSIAQVVEKMEGISNVKQSNDDGKIVLSYDFADFAAINRAENMDNEGTEDHDFFKATKKGVAFNPRPADYAKEMKQDGADEKEMMDMMNNMLEIRTTISFDKKVKSKKMEHFDKVDDRTFSYNSKKHGIIVEPYLEIQR